MENQPLNYTSMKFLAARLAALSLSFAVLLLPATTLAAGSGEATIRALVASMKTYAQAKTPAERAAAAAKVSRRLALRKLASDSLGAEWQKLGRAERDRFVSLFTRALETLAYPRAAKALTQIRVDYVRETAKSPGRVVETTVTRPEGGKLPIDYTLTRQGGRWIVADVSLDGESLAKAVHARIQKALKQEGYQKLVADLEKHVEPASSTAPANRPGTVEEDPASKVPSERSVRLPSR